VIGSFPLAKLKVALLSAELNESSNEMAVSVAAGDAFENGLRQAGPTLLEPIMKLAITTPDEFYGEFLSDLAQRRARVVHTDSYAGTTAIEAHAPLAELLSYSNALRSLSQGRAGSSMEPLEYAPAPAEVAAGFGV
jgi:elongation factor G